MPLHHTYLSYQDHLYPYYYLCHYLPASAGRDHLSHSLLKFKKRRHPDLEAWIDCSLELLAQAPIPPDTTIVRALHHDETTPSSGSPLDILGQQLARELRHQYQPQLLQKSHPSQPIKIFSKTRREEELQGLYRVDTSTLREQPKHWLIIDDILTSGATIRAILQAIHETCPPDTTPIQIFTLAKATTNPSLHPISLKGRHYQFGVSASTWGLAEDPAPYYSLDQLKNNILRDAF